MAGLVRIKCKIDAFTGNITKGNKDHTVLMHSDKIDLSIHTHTKNGFVYTPIFNHINGIDHKKFMVDDWKNEMISVKPYEWVLNDMRTDFGISIPNNYDHQKSGMDMDENIIYIGAIYMLDLCISVEFYYIMLKLKIKEL